MAAGSIAEQLDLPAATLSFHLAGLARAPCQEPAGRPLRAALKKKLDEIGRK